ncbi:MAG: carbohydrate ABC transporter permease [Spirochaetales bacterium]|nr:carbohydrate ABC transporter permease [Spirochaetales bacterium]
MLYPFLNSLAISFNEANDTARGGISIFPRKFTLLNYQVVLANAEIYRAFAISVIRTFIGTLLSVLVTAMLAYGLSKKELKGQKIFMGFCVVTMYFNGGLIPTYVVIKSLNLLNTFWVMILPLTVNVFNMIIFKAFFENLPKSIEESAKVDGAGYFTIFTRIVVPTSKPVLATISLFVAVVHWNSWFDASIYITNKNLLPIQTVLQKIINSNVMNDQLSKMNANAAEMMRISSQVSTESLLMATMMVATIPILMIYPFLQKYFAKGVLLGSVKE